MPVLRLLASAIFSPVSGLDPAWSLIPLSILFGVALLWAFGRLSNQAALRETKRHIGARMYELRLFVDEPKLIFQAQGALLRHNLKHLLLVLLPVAILTVPMALVFGHLDAFYGYAPLEPGRAALVTVQFAESAAHMPPPELELPEGFVAETPPVRALALRQASWRVRALRPASGELHLRLGRESVAKTISSLPGPRYLSKRRVSSWGGLLQFPAEPRLSSAPVVWIDVGYPEAEVSWLGLPLHWIGWFLLVSMATALALSRRFGVSF